MADYYTNPRLSNSKLSVLARDPIEFKARYVDDPPTWEPPENDSLVFGNLVHCMVLEPHLLDSRYVVPSWIPSGNSKVAEIVQWLLDPKHEGLEMPYAIRPEGINRRTNEGKKQWAMFVDFCESNGHEIVDADDLEEAMKYAKEVKGRQG